MKKIMLFVLVASVILTAGCAEQQKPITEIMIDGHGSEVYTFSNDIRESLKVNVNYPEEIRRIGLAMKNLNIAFNGSNSQDNAYFRVVLTDMAAKLPLYYSYEGKYMTFNISYYTDNMSTTWYDSAGNVIDQPAFDTPTVWFLGPSTGANETSLRLADKTIYLSGTSYKNLTMAGDKLVLLFFGVNKV